MTIVSSDASGWTPTIETYDTSRVQRNVRWALRSFAWKRTTCRSSRVPTSSENQVAVGSAAVNR